MLYPQLPLQFLKALLAAEICLKIPDLTTHWRICRPKSDEHTQGFAASPGSWFYQLQICLLLELCKMDLAQATVWVCTHKGRHLKD